ncbi:MAG: hypothetical protein ACE3L7_23800 [Candidatus Pristimantibacillus sp.]
MKNIILISCLLGGIVVSQVPTASMILPIDEVQASSSPTVHADSTTNDELDLQTVNDLTLYDNTAVVLEKMGRPEKISRDDWFDEIMIYEYPEMNIAFRDGIIEYVDVRKTAETISIDESVIPATIEALKKALGQPDYVAEDGIVFQRNEALLKLFIDPETGELDSISYYHLSSV